MTQLNAVPRRISVSTEKVGFSAAFFPESVESDLRSIFLTLRDRVVDMIVEDLPGFLLHELTQLLKIFSGVGIEPVELLRAGQTYQLVAHDVVNRMFP